MGLNQISSFFSFNRFSTQLKNGLLFYNGRFNEKHDFIALEIIDRQLRFSFNLGDNVTSVTSNVEGGVSNGAWQHVTVEYLNRVGDDGGGGGVGAMPHGGQGQQRDVATCHR